MKITVHQNTSRLIMTAESKRDNFVLGKIASKIKGTQSSQYPSNEDNYEISVTFSDLLIYLESTT